jgi:hypothetical protein
MMTAGDCGFGNRVWKIPRSPGKNAVENQDEILLFNFVFHLVFTLFLPAKSFPFVWTCFNYAQKFPFSPKQSEDLHNFIKNFLAVSLSTPRPHFHHLLHLKVPTQRQ